MTHDLPNSPIFSIPKFSHIQYTYIVGDQCNKERKVLRHISAQVRIVLTFTKNDLTLVEVYAVALNFGLDTCHDQINCTGQYQ